MPLSQSQNEFVSYLGGKCQECGSIEDLEFHHRDEADKCFSIMSKWKLSLEEIKLELDKCDLLCHECHYQRTRAQRGWSHTQASLLRQTGEKCIIRVIEMGYYKNVGIGARRKMLSKSIWLGAVPSIPAKI